jgi:hypothetical protein
MRQAVEICESGVCRVPLVHSELVAVNPCARNQRTAACQSVGSTQPCGCTSSTRYPSWGARARRSSRVPEVVQQFSSAAGRNGAKHLQARRSPSGPVHAYGERLWRTASWTSPLYGPTTGSSYRCW